MTTDAKSNRPKQRKRTNSASKQANPIEYINTARILKLKGWKKLFPNLQCKLMISKALNYCSKNKGLKLAGYLITDRNLYIVPYNTASKVDEIICDLELYLKIEIARELKFNKELRKGKPNETDSIQNLLEYKRKVFDVFYLLNVNLIEVLTRKIPAVQGDFYNPEMAKIIDMTAQATFCSVPALKSIELGLETGPVYVWHPDFELKTLRKEDEKKV